MYDLLSLANICEGKVVGNSDLLIKQLTSLANISNNSLSYIYESNMTNSIEGIEQAAYIVKPEFKELIKNGIVHDNPKKAFRIISNLYLPQPKTNKIETTAQVDISAKISKDVYIGHHVVIEESVTISSGCIINSNTVIRKNSTISKNTKIGSNVVIEHDSHIGENCDISSGVIIGSEGFGNSFEGGQWKHMPQLGKVIIGNNVEIGANSCIDRGAIDNTIIHNGVIIDNLVHIAHNVEIGKHTAMAALVGVAGSTKIGSHCMFGGQVGISGHIKVVDNVLVNAGATVLQSIKKPGKYAGAFPILESNKWNKNIIYFKKIENLFKRKKSE